jgi:broad specificity phosphatase PhoE
MEIALARHGRPDLDQRAWVAPRQLAHWLRAYNAAGIVVASVPPQVLEAAIRAGIIVSSPLLRCEQSVHLLAPMRSILTDGVFCEAGLPHSHWALPRLPLHVWMAIFRIAWFCGYSSNSESLPAAVRRARRAAERLMELAAEHGSVFAMGHGIMTMLIAKQLLLMGWNGPKRPALQYWQFGVYRFPSAM